MTQPSDTSHGTVVLKPRRLEDIARPGFKLKRPVVVLFVQRGPQIAAMISTPLIQALGANAEGALEALKDRVVQTYEALDAKGDARSAEESEIFDMMCLWLAR